VAIYMFFNELSSYPDDYGHYPTGNNCTKDETFHPEISDDIICSLI